MKKVLIVGANSYIGESFAKYAEDYFQIDTVGTLADKWKNSDFSSYQSILHVAGIAHLNERKVDTEIYYKVNRDLAGLVAQKAKDCGVRQFVFLSTMSVYSKDVEVINQDTIPLPYNFYGKSKYEAEKLIEKMSNDKFCVALVRPPMVYGKGCKGNFPKLAKMALFSPIFPDIENSRSMIYIENLCRSLKYIIDKECSGVLFPQNREYVCTTELVNQIAQINGKRIYNTNLFNGIIRLLSKRVKIINKVFGSLAYDKELSGVFEAVNYMNLEESLKEMYGLN